MSQVFTLPDVGEGLTEADILAWKVSKGDTVSVNQVLVEIETAKSVVELPSPYAGTVQELMVAEGDTVDVGTPIITVSSGDDAPAGGTDPGYTGTVPQNGLAGADGAAAGAEGEDQAQGQAPAVMAADQPCQQADGGQQQHVANQGAMPVLVHGGSLGPAASCKLQD